ncbi:hypothetical protein GOV09_04215 [Candidatus Woesearchaeota archaeon]|nr:hypothetical protein [Candidatus Woesearchaeota archaeon]
MADLDHDVIDLFLYLGEFHGWDALTSTICAILFIEPKEVALTDLAKKTGYSLASCCIKVQQLEKSGLVKKLSKPGSKKVYASMEKDLFAHWMNMIKRAMTYKVGHIKNVLPDIIKRHKNADKRKIKILEGWHKDVVRIEGIFQELIKRMEHD